MALANVVNGFASDIETIGPGSVPGGITRRIVDTGAANWVIRTPAMTLDIEIDTSNPWEEFLEPTTTIELRPQVLSRPFMDDENDFDRGTVLFFDLSSTLPDQS
jgi:hypothetical protein